MNISTEYSSYRALYETHTEGMETEGIFYESDFASILDDPRTAVLEQTNGGRVPLLTPFEHRSNWFHETLYRQWAGERTPLYYYNHLPALKQRQSAVYRETLRDAIEQLEREGALIVLDHPESAGDAIAAEMNDMGISITDIPYESADTRHFQYASIIQPTLPNTKPVTMETCLQATDIEQLWSFYNPSFEAISVVDPVHSGFTEAEFTEVMRSPDFMKFVFRAGETIVNLCLITDVRNCEWMNQAYYKKEFPEKYDSGEVWCSPGVLTNPNATGQAAASLRTMCAVGRLIADRNKEIALSFVCNSISDKQVPGLSQRSLERVGVRSDFSQPLAKHIFRVCRLGIA